jgi:hypothetical protein
VRFTLVFTVFPIVWRKRHKRLYWESLFLSTYHGARSIVTVSGAQLQTAEQISNGGKLAALGCCFRQLVESRDSGPFVRELVRSQKPIEAAVPINNDDASLRKLIPRTFGIEFAAVCPEHIPDATTLEFATKLSKLIADRISLKPRTIDAS